MDTPVAPWHLAPAERVQAPAHWQCVEFISDLHLGEHDPHTAQVFLRHLQHTPAQALFILGDFFESWVGDDQAQRPFESAILAALRARQTQGLALHLMVGNRDFLLGPEAAQAGGWRRLADLCTLILGEERLLLCHGDAACLSDHPYQAFRQQVRQSEWQSAFLARPLAERLAFAAQARAHSQAQKSPPSSPASWSDVDATWAGEQLQVHGAQGLIHGHTHQVGCSAWQGPTDGPWPHDAPRRAHWLGPAVPTQAGPLPRPAGLHRCVLPDWDGPAPAVHGLRWIPTGWSWMRA